MRLAVVALCLGIVLQVVTPAAADVRPRKGWLRLQSPNFLLIGDVGARDLRQVAERLEQFREALGILLPKAVVSTSTPTTVVVFKTHKSFEPLNYASSSFRSKRSSPSIISRLCTTRATRHRSSTPNRGRSCTT